MSEVIRLSLLEAHRAVSGFVPLRPTQQVEPVVPEADAYALGFADGQQAASEIFAVEHASFAKLLAAANAFQPEPSEELAGMIVLTVERLVTEITGAAPVDPDWLCSRVNAATALIAEADAARTLWLHPDDLPLVAGIATDLIPMADPSLERGALRIDCSAGWIEDGRSIHLDALRAELGIGTTR